MKHICHLQDFLKLDNAHLNLLLSNLKYQLFPSHKPPGPSPRFIYLLPFSMHYWLIPLHCYWEAVTTNACRVWTVGLPQFQKLEKWCTFFWWHTVFGFFSCYRFKNFRLQYLMTLWSFSSSMTVSCKFSTLFSTAVLPCICPHQVYWLIFA